MTGVSSRRTQLGTTFIEMLVTLVVISTGLFSVGLMSARSVSMADEAMLHSQAVQLAQDVIDRARVNSNGLTSYATSYTDAPTTSSSCLAVKCSPTNLALTDLVDWKNKLAEALPQGQGQIEVTGTTVLVSVRWKIRGGDQTYQLQAIDT